MTSPTRPELIEKAAKELARKWCLREGHVWDSETWECLPLDTILRFRADATDALLSIADDLRAEGAAEARTAQLPTLQAMGEYANAIRGDWNNFDGRTMKEILNGWEMELASPDPDHTIEWHRRDRGICMAGGGHWCGRWGYCDDDCGCEPCAEDRASADQ